MAIDILTIPIMSNKLEQVFSGAKITLQGRHTTLVIELLQALEQIKSWNKLKDFNYINVFEEFIMTEGSINREKGSRTLESILEED